MGRVQEMDEEVIHVIEALPFLVGTDVELAEENAQRFLRSIADGSSQWPNPRKTSARFFLSRL